MIDAVGGPFRMSFWDPRCLPFYLSVFSGLYLISKRIPRSLGRSETSEASSSKALNGEGITIAQTRTTLIIQSVRLVAVLAIFGISLSLLIVRGGSERQINILLVTFSVSLEFFIKYL